MTALSTPVFRFLAVALVAGGLGAGIYFAVQAGGGGDEDAQVVAQLTETATPLAPTDTPAPPARTATQLPPTQPPADVPATEPPPASPIPTATPYPPLPPPPPRPDSPTLVTSESLPGGQWYRFQFPRCIALYLPSGYTFSVHQALNDPGGFMTLFIQPEGQSSFIRFLLDNLTEETRDVESPELLPVFDQIAATLSFC